MADGLPETIRPKTMQGYHLAGWLPLTQRRRADRPLADQRIPSHVTLLPSPHRVRVIHVATYGGPYAGSFIPAIRALARAVSEHGWSFEIVFSPDARGRLVTRIDE